LIGSRPFTVPDPGCNYQPGSNPVPSKRGFFDIKRIGLNVKMGQIVEKPGGIVVFYLLIILKFIDKAAAQSPQFFIPIHKVRNGSIWNTNKR